MNERDSKKIKVLEVTRSLNFGGLEKLVAILASKFDREKFDVSVCCILRKGAFAEVLEKEGIRIFLLNEDGSKKANYFSFLKLAKLLRQEKPDIIHSHNTHALLDSVLARLIVRTPVHVHTDHARNFPDKKKYMVLERLCSFLVTKMIAVSKFSKQQLVEYEKIHPKRIDVIYNGIPVGDEEYNVEDCKKALGVSNCFPVLGALSRLTEQKAVHYMIEALPGIINKFPNAVLFVVGDGVKRPFLEEEAEKLGVAPHVHFEGYKKEIGKYLSMFDVFLLSSIWEGMPLGLIEAMSYGKPIVAADVGGVSEVVEHGQTGRVIAPRNPEAIADAVIQCITEEGALRDMGIAAEERYRTLFTEEVMTRNYEQAFSRFMGNKS